MPRRKTQEEFIEQAKGVWGDKFCYDKTNYIGMHEKIILICPSHGEFEQIANTHVRGSDCPDCAEENRRKNSILPIPVLIAEFRKAHKNKYTYPNIEEEYTTQLESKITIICPDHGSFKQLPGKHKDGQGCRDCGYEKNSENFSLAIEEYYSRAKKVHKNKYSYPVKDYTRLKFKITIKCEEHGVFKQNANDHLQGHGCVSCGYIQASRDLDSIIEQSNQVHEHKYGYDKSVYTGIDKKMIITCYEHGDFLQKVQSHLQGHGCPDCGEEVRVEKLRKRGTLWSHSKWTQEGDLSKQFDSYKLYVIELKEGIYKIGKTYRTIESRLREFPYSDIKIIDIITSNDGKNISSMEEQLKNLCYPFKVIPEKDFGGKHECFSSIAPIIPLLE